MGAAAAGLAAAGGPGAGAAFQALGLAAAALAALAALRAALGLALWALEPRGAPLAVPLEPEEAAPVLRGAGKATPKQKVPFAAKEIPCFDPGSLQELPPCKVTSPQEVRQRCERARTAQRQWAKSSFRQRRHLLRTLQRFTMERSEDICRVSARDSGKAMIDAGLGEVLTTCEKIHWLLKEGEHWLRPERRSAGTMLFYKRATVEWHPVGVVGAIVPWNYPFHNILGPVTAAVLAGDAIVIKVSEHASWSANFYSRFLEAALAACGAPPDLVQIVTGFGETGDALVRANVDKLIFIGSVGVGRKVAEAAADSLTPVVMELGGKDAVIVCPGADLEQVYHHTLRGGLQSCGQNCVGAERFFIHDSCYDGLVPRVAEQVRAMRQGHALARPGGTGVDCGAMCMPGQAERLQLLVEDAVAKGAKVLAGGKMRGAETGGQFFAPTVLEGITSEMRIWEEETFGPIISVVRWSDEDEMVDMVNDSPFGLGCNVFGPARAAKRVGDRIHSGMLAINDFATTYMCQSLPFGGVKESGYDRFAGVEGLRGMCFPKSICEDAFPGISTSVPPPIQYPVPPIAFPFFQGLIYLFYSEGLVGKLWGMARLAACFVLPSSVKPKAD